MKPLIFIDGEAGTTGLQIHSRLNGRTDIELLQLPYADRKDPVKRAEALNTCDVAILCLPDDAAVEAVSFIENPKVRVLDPSSAHRTTPGWVYGLPELTAGQADIITTAKRVSNPGCYPTGAIALLRPLTEAGVVPKDYPVNVHAISGYSGSGKSLIDAYEIPDHPQHTDAPYRGYGLSLNHKHVPEMMSEALLDHRPIFTPGYGKYRQGIVLYVPLHLRLLPAGASVQQIHACLSNHYAKSEFIKVVPLDQVKTVTQLDPEYLNDTNRLDIYVFSDEKSGQVLLAAVYDNLGKGASGAAVQNLNLMLNGQA
ncbi:MULTISPECIES: N-acetyl-gamma-glutamyl-phosphate reductase [unclassified Pseudomonas]|jgi:N-acetyl-gamma-glutamyl-phosphate reductase|uniref:N-acetyl-gamma-glutamyl-phosphate reductase n=1 Tax=unclassified Pseudomonas TaxID=196821 RepID=UPI0002704070|nr:MULTISPECIES: N-acetyl-gamma-glutamyl-phosphate reductase [unclassified Pseudomonas]EJM35665.1 N-acetyl-gamma-glutamyl-phosphate reductase, uncommon form [Pseudomonas sp. GM24]